MGPPPASAYTRTRTPVTLRPAIPKATSKVPPAQPANPTTPSGSTEDIQYWRDRAMRAEAQTDLLRDCERQLQAQCDSLRERTAAAERELMLLQGDARSRSRSRSVSVNRGRPGASVREESIKEEPEDEEEIEAEAEQDEPASPKAMEVDQEEDDTDVHDPTAAASDSARPAPPAGVQALPAHQAMPLGPGRPKRGMDEEPWAAGLSRDQIVDIACHIRHELISAGQERTKTGWRGPTAPGRNVNFTLRHNLRWWFRPLDDGTRYND